MQPTKKPKPTQPFFARFLQTDELRKVNGSDESTNKHPSDREDPSTDIEVLP